MSTDHAEHEKQVKNFREWPFEEAKRILKLIEREKKSSVLFETGYGPSGLPHIGTFGEVARTSYVRTALKELAPEIESKIITFSDDMDGLRSLPENVPNHEMLSSHLGKPLNSVPDPYGEFESFSANMNNRLKEFLNSYGFEYEFRSSTDMYRGGHFNHGLSVIMKNHEKIIKIFTSMISEEKAATWSPFFPTCENCGKVYTTRVTGHHVDTNEVSYECSNASNPKIVPCGHKGKVSIFDGKVKVGWKIDWALRWYSLGINYEMYGKDLIDSCIVSEKVVKLMGGRPPITYKYELFLDEEGGKISKKIGNGISLEEWLSYAPRDVLLFFMYSKPSQAKRMGLPLIPKYIDEWMRVLASYQGAVDSPIRLIKNRDIVEDRLQIPTSKVDYSLILNLVRALNVNDPAFIMDYLLVYDPSVARDAGYFRSLVEYAITYNEEFMKHRKIELKINHDLDKYLELFKTKLLELEAQGGVSPETVQTLTFDIAKENGLASREWFTHIYQALLSQESGPKIGSFICLFGLKPSVERIEQYLSKAQQDQA